MTKKKQKNPFAKIAEGVSTAISAIALTPVFIISSLLD